MVKIESIGNFHYEITGEREQEAAQELESKLNFIMRDYRNPYTVQDISDTRRDISEKYGVEIRAVI